MQTNTEFDLAFEIINYTRRNVFLTGKAGTGKTTFLRHLVQHSPKNIVVAAPTGVAAINAGGVTLHSLFFLPFQAFVPTLHSVDRNIAINKDELLRTLRISNQKREVIEEMELLIIDEISMVRADLLDAVNIILQFIRKNKQAFGGVQVLMIGDMYQLPPIIKPNEWEILQEYYASQYFFDSKVLENNEPVCIELKTVYRQTNASFISILNNIRHQHLTEEDERLINSRYIPNFQTKEEGWITLSTHNQTVHAINQNFLNELQGKEHHFKAEVKGNFNENLYPIDETFVLKVGAQIMFIKNDSTIDKMYFNGKLAKVKSINEDKITVTFLDSQDDFVLVKEVWRNVEYFVNAETGEIEEKELGTFKHYPIKLAWAITIHKSQGLTFDKVIIDMGRSFAPGQVYVAMSRCTSLEGIVLISKINSHKLFTDSKIVDFQNRILDTEVIQEIIESEKFPEAISSLKDSMYLKPIHKALLKWYNEIISRKIPEKDAVIKLYHSIELKFESLKKISHKFEDFLDKNYNLTTENWQIIEERSKKAIEYYINEIENEIIKPFETHFQSYKKKEKIKQYLKELQSIQSLIRKNLEQFYEFHLLGKKLYEKTRIIKDKSIEIKEEIPEKKSTHDATFELYQQNLSIEDISKLRNLKIQTIEEHIIKLIIENKIIEILPFISNEKIENISKFYSENPDISTLSEAKSKLGEGYSFFEIKLVKEIFKMKNKI